MQWARPMELRPGLTLAVQFAFPTSELQHLQHVAAAEFDGAAPIPSAGPEEAIVVALFLSRPGAFLDGRWPAEHGMSSKSLAEFGLPGGEHVHLVYWSFTPPDITRVDLDENRREFSHMTDGPDRRARFCIIVINDDGSRIVVEGAVHPDYPC
jgi:Ser/Thr protein kinase RdoA (MazF antagonist)